MKVVIVEDEGLATRNLRTILEEIGEIEVVATLESITETLEWFHQQPEPDLLFLDIHLADGSAFEIFEQISIACPIIFTTAYDEYALKAFSVNSIAYLLKPIDVNSVRRALDKLENFTSIYNPEENVRMLIETLRRKPSWKTHFLVPVKGDKLVPVQTREIASFYIDTGVVKAMTFEGRTFTMDHTLDDLSGMLNPVDFFRANRQYIIARSAVKDIDLWFNGRLSINLNVPTPEKILISKARVPEFRNWFAGT